MKDFMITSLEQDEYRLHTAIAEAFGSGKDAGQKFPLYRRTPGSSVATVRLSDPPEHLAHVGQEVIVPEVGSELEFTLASHAARSGGGKRFTCKSDEERLQWLKDRSVACGFKLLGAPAIETEKVKIKKAGKEWGFRRTTYYGRLKVEDKTKLAQAMAHGVGSSMRSFGCGLLTIHLS
ncbi:type I-E CRISPR-associated protein Cas6/Cse3/CasE [Aestuariivita boseongensis]|uniref:type I-E CRISPR-associated protein Cas6/Cse3/CasE n=1 Tax=Aestuariivita boseongensis TaxID=1470562 RepID=UPI0006836E99|nr:type I-E CRISPR-associated protein Cas6/Cse3/CasE [Aestuariivita boseongensis]